MHAFMIARKIIPVAIIAAMFDVHSTIEMAPQMPASAKMLFLLQRSDNMPVGISKSNEMFPNAMMSPMVAKLTPFACIEMKSIGAYTKKLMSTAFNSIFHKFAARRRLCILRFISHPV
jgi:hypothetical protein